MKEYKAPWGMWLWSLSTLGTTVCLGVAMSISSVWWRALSLGFIVVAALFSIRGYSITPGFILVHRLFWSTRLPLAGLQSVYVPRDEDRHAITIRIFGNGGFFSFTGWHWSRAIGAYRAFATDPRRAVVLKFFRGTVVLSPDSPEDFVRELSPQITHA